MGMTYSKPLLFPMPLETSSCPNRKCEMSHQWDMSSLVEKWWSTGTVSSKVLQDDATTILLLVLERSEKWPINLCSIDPHHYSHLLRFMLYSAVRRYYCKVLSKCASFFWNLISLRWCNSWTITSLLDSHSTVFRMSAAHFQHCPHLSPSRRVISSSFYHLVFMEALLPSSESRIYFFNILNFICPWIWKCWTLAWQDFVKAHNGSLDFSSVAHTACLVNVKCARSCVGVSCYSVLEHPVGKLPTRKSSQVYRYNDTWNLCFLLSWLWIFSIF